MGGWLLVFVDMSVGITNDYNNNQQLQEQQRRVVCVVKKDVAPLDPCFGARLVRVTYRIHNLNASVRVKNSVTSPALEGRQEGVPVPA